MFEDISLFSEPQYHISPFGLAGSLDRWAKPRPKAQGPRPKAQGPRVSEKEDHLLPF